MKLAFIGLKGHVGTVLAGAKLLGDVEVVAAAEDDAELLASLIKKDPLLATAQPYQHWRHLIEHTMMDVCCFRSTEIALQAREAADETKMIAQPPMRPVRGLK